jgi:hypothetical protein
VSVLRMTVPAVSSATLQVCSRRGNR